MKKAKRRYQWFKHYHACWVCGQKATWHYSPCSERPPEQHNYCEKCVPRGCSCQIDDETGKPRVDERGRELPCIEYMHHPNGIRRVWPRPPSLRKKSAGQYRKTLDCPERIDRRRWRGELRRWLRQPEEWWSPPARRRVRNDPTTSRVLKQTYPLVTKWRLREQ